MVGYVAVRKVIERASEPTDGPADLEVRMGI